MAISSSYTTADHKAISAAWYALQRAVESNALQEQRVAKILRTEAKTFGRIAAKSHIIGMIRHAIVAPDSEVVTVAHYRDERVLCAMVGVYLRDNENPGALVSVFLVAEEAELAAQQRFLATLNTTEGK